MTISRKKSLAELILDALQTKGTARKPGHKKREGIISPP